MLGEVLLNKDLPIYEYQNTKLTVNNQTWIGGIAGLRNLEWRRNECWSGLIDSLGTY